MSRAQVRKALVLILSLPDAEAAPLLAQLTPQELAAIASEVERRQPISAGERAQVVAELTQHVGQKLPALRRRTVPAETLRLERFSYLRNVDSQTIAHALGDEHPQVAALVLSHLPQPQRDRVLQILPAEQSVSVARRVARLAEVAEDVVADVERGLEHNLASAMLRWLPEVA